MYNCHLDTQPGDLGPFKGCYSVTSTERSFSPRSKKRLETSKHPLNGGSGFFLFELIGINRGMIKKVGQNLSPKIKQVGYRRSKCRWITYFNVSKTLRRAWRHKFTKSDRRWEGPSTDVNECWPCSEGVFHVFSSRLWGKCNANSNPKLACIMAEMFSKKWSECFFIDKYAFVVTLQHYTYATQPGRAFQIGCEL